jgi:hypothetical protein
MAPAPARLWQSARLGSIACADISVLRADESLQYLQEEGNLAAWVCQTQHHCLTTRISTIHWLLRIVSDNSSEEPAGLPLVTAMKLRAAAPNPTVTASALERLHKEASDLLHDVFEVPSASGRRRKLRVCSGMTCRFEKPSNYTLLL